MFSLPAWTRTRFDQFGKQMVRSAVASRGSVETDAEVPADTRRIDLWFMPDPACEPIPGYLGLLGRITAGPSTLEFFHNTPSGDDLADCLIKHGQFRHYLSLRKPPLPIPTQWVISSGRPKGGIEGLRLHRLEGWPPGIYEGPPLLWTRLVVVSELPDTLLLHGVSKGALNALTRILAKELASRQIRVNAACPGWVRTDMGGRGAPRSVEEGAASVLFGVTATETGGVFRDGRRIAP
jgi:hypothetical protein